MFRDDFCNGFVIGPMYIGYARVSPENQHLDIQLQKLKAAGCKRIFQEKISGARRERPELAQMWSISARATRLSSGSSTASRAPRVICSKYPTRFPNPVPD